MNAVALCSCPRLGFMDFMGNALVAFGNNRIGVHHLYGVFWAQALEEGMKECVEAGYEFIFTCDYDTLFKDSDVKTLLDLITAHPEVDALTSFQVGRFGSVLLSTKDSLLSKDELKNDIMPIETGHFGLTVIRASALKNLEKPWFFKQASSDGGWKKGSDKIDEDIWFWKNFPNLYLAPRVVVGHLELLVKWPDTELQSTYQELGHYRDVGKPPDVWT